IPLRLVLRVPPGVDPGMVVVRVELVGAQSHERQQVRRLVAAALGPPLAVADRPKAADRGDAAASAHVPVALADRGARPGVRAGVAPGTEGGAGALHRLPPPQGTGAPHRAPPAAGWYRYSSTNDSGPRSSSTFARVTAT